MRILIDEVIGIELTRAQIWVIAVEKQLTPVNFDCGV